MSPAEPHRESRPPGATEWRTREVAIALGVAESTISSYRARNQMPAPDGRDRYGPWWYPDTITNWAASRPGPGNRSSRRGHRTPGNAAAGPGLPDADRTSHDTTRDTPRIEGDPR